MITIFRNITETKTPHYVSLETIVNRIRDGKSRELVEKIRAENDKAVRNKLKAQLPSICFSGKFRERKNDAILKHSGLVCLDFDNMSSTDLQVFRDSLQDDKYTHVMFTSPSGNGLKLVVKIPAEIKNHAASCRALSKYYKTQYLDDFKDVARVCYESYDPNIFYNKDSEVFNDLIIEEIKEIKRAERQTDSSIIFENLRKWIESRDFYSDGNKHKFLVKFAGALNRFGISKFEAANLLKMSYQHAAGYVKSEDFDKIVNRVYANYTSQHGSSFFETTGTAYEVKTDERLTDNIFELYEDDSYTKKMQTIIQKTYIDLDCPPPPPATILSIRNSFDMKPIRLFTLGNISAIVGKAKSKKTFANSLLAGAMVKNGDSGIFVANIPKEKPFILLFDTEQSKFDAYNVANRIKKLSQSNDDVFATYSMRGMDGSEIIEFIDYQLNVTFKGLVSVVIIDQVADLVRSLNDEQEAVRVLKWMERTTVKQDLHISGILHSNKYNDFAQGWLGTQFLKKAETIIKVTKQEFNPSISVVEPDATRGEEFESFAFKIEEDGMPRILSKNEFNQVNIDI